MKGRPGLSARAAAIAFVASTVLACSTLTGLDQYAVKGCQACTHALCASEVDACNRDAVCGASFECVVERCPETTGDPSCTMPCAPPMAASNALIVNLRLCVGMSCRSCFPPEGSGADASLPGPADGRAD